MSDKKILNKNKNTTVVIGGDFYPSSIFAKQPELPQKDLWGTSKELFQNSDLSIINLEAPLTKNNIPINKTGPNIKLDPENIKLLKDVNIKLVTLANNHMLDFGKQGIEDTLKICEENGIETVGAGLNLAEAKKTYYKEMKGIKIAVVNFAENEFNSAEADSAGSNPMNIIDNIKQIRDAKKNADFVLVIVHGGHEYYKYPSPRMQKQYRFYAEEGANIVVGHHTHCVSGYEVHNGAPIFYSLGNLFFPWKNKPLEWHEGMLLKLQITTDNKIDLMFELIPYFQSMKNTSIIIMKEVDKGAFFKKIDDINKVIADGNLLKQKWGEFVNLRKKEYLQYVFVPFYFVRKFVGKLKLLKLFYSKKQNLLIYNLINCESHKELLRESLNEKLRGVYEK